MSRISRQESLFDSVNSNKLTVTDVVTHTKPQTKQQAVFQRLIQQIDEQRTQVAKWHTYSGCYSQRVSGELMPLLAQLREKRIAMLHLLDKCYQRDVVRGKQQRAKLCDIILSLAHNLLHEQRDETIVALYDKYSELAYDEQAELDQALSQNMVENLFGVHLDDDDVDVSMDGMLAKAMRKHQEEEAKRGAKQSSHRRKSAKQTAAEEKRATAKKETIQSSVREIYRKLVSSLHPDRTSANLTTDEKTILMQRVNQAYGKGDLLKLLNIQLKIEQIDTDYLANLPDERIEHYIQVLREQLAELKAELASLLIPYRTLVPYIHKIKPSHVDKAMDAEVAKLEMNLRQVDIDLEAFQDAKQLATFIKYYQADNESGELDDWLDSFSKPSPSPSRRRKR
jgi:hypothetical protein